MTELNSATSESQPEIEFSIVIPTYNRHDGLQRCLSALCEVNYPGTAFEVVIVDDGGDPPLELIEQFSSRLNLRCLRQENSGPATARNAGIAVARGKYIALTDDDCAPDKDWLTKLKECFDRDPKCAVAGRVENGLTDNPYSMASQLLIDYLMAYYSRTGANKRFGTSNNLAFPRGALLEIRGFDESFPLSAAEDRELIDRWVAAGNELIYAREAVVVHYHQMSLGGFTRQHSNYGRGAYRYHSIRASRARDAINREPASFYMGMLKYPFEHGFGLFSGIRIAFLISWSQVVNAFGYFREKRANTS